MVNCRADPCAPSRPPFDHRKDRVRAWEPGAGPVVGREPAVFGVPQLRSSL